jgi:hypothetical protein
MSASLIETANSTLPVYELPKGNLTEIANNTGGSIAIGVMSLLWLAWIVTSMLVSWQNSAFTNAYNPPITYIWTLISPFSVLESFLPSGYFISWVVNFVVFFVELVAWWAQGDFLALWVYVGLWGGFVGGAMPWVFMLIYIADEYPRKYGTQW